MNRVAIINCGVGNIQSVVNSCRQYMDDIIQVESGSDLNAISPSRIIMPGVGAVSSCLQRLKQTGLENSLMEKIITDKIPFLGICVGMQILATTCEEFGTSDGLNIIPGRVRKLAPKTIGLPVPHVGWNSISIKTDQTPCNIAPLDGKDFYFVHSFAFECDEHFVVASTDYGGSFNSIIRKANVFGVQFHPEKSSAQGQMLFKLFLENGSL